MFSVCRPILSGADQPLLDQLFPPPGQTWSFNHHDEDGKYQGDQ